MASNTSVLHKMSFETSIKFLINAVVKHDPEGLKYPSSRLMLGMHPELGVGAGFEVRNTGTP